MAGERNGEEKEEEEEEEEETWASTRVADTARLDKNTFTTQKERRITQSSHRNKLEQTNNCKIERREDQVPFLPLSSLSLSLFLCVCVCGHEEEKRAAHGLQSRPCLVSFVVAVSWTERKGRKKKEESLEW